MSELRERLQRLLLLVPRVAGIPEGVPVEALAEELGLSVEALQEELDFLLLVGRPPFSPADFLDIYVEEGRVYAPLTLSLDRPPRFTHDEALALSVGIDALTTEADEGFGAALLEIVRVIEAAMNPEERERYLSLRMSVVMGSPASGARGDLHRILREAIEARQWLSLAYYSARREAFGERELCPYGLLNHQGYWYLAAGPEGDQGFKLFRVDRIADARPIGEAGDFEVPELALAQLRPGHVMRASGTSVPRVRVSASKARFAKEQVGEGDCQANADGSVTVSFPLASCEWVSSWALAYAPEAEILGPPELVERARADLARSLALYEGEALAPSAGAKT